LNSSLVRVRVRVRVDVDKGIAVSSNSLVSEVFELPPLALALEDFVDLEAGAADFEFVTRMFGRANSVGSFNRCLGKCHHRGDH
jgi:hypothetical protein